MKTVVAEPASPLTVTVDVRGEGGQGTGAGVEGGDPVPGQPVDVGELPADVERGAVRRGRDGPCTLPFSVGAKEVSTPVLDVVGQRGWCGRPPGCPAPAAGRPRPGELPAGVHDVADDLLGPDHAVDAAPLAAGRSRRWPAASGREGWCRRRQAPIRSRAGTPNVASTREAAANRAVHRLDRVAVEWGATGRGDLVMWGHLRVGVRGGAWEQVALPLSSAVESLQRAQPVRQPSRTTTQRCRQLMTVADLTCREDASPMSCRSPP